MKKYEYIDELAPADCAFKAYGADLAEVFANAALAVTARMVDPQTIDSVEELEISLEAQNLTDLLYDWLAEIIYLKDAEVIFLRDFRISLSRGNTRLKALARGEKINPQKHRIFTDVKAVTMHRFSLEQSEQGWEACVVLDL